MPALKNPRHEAFAQAIFSGIVGAKGGASSQAEAYRRAGYHVTNCNSARACASILIGRASLLFVDRTALCGSSDVPPTSAPLTRGFFCARPGNAKGPVIRDGAFRTFLRWRGMLSDPANFSIRYALIWFQGRPVACRAATEAAGCPRSLAHLAAG